MWDGTPSPRPLGSNVLDFYHLLVSKLSYLRPKIFAKIHSARCQKKNKKTDRQRNRPPKDDKKTDFESLQEEDVEDQAPGDMLTQAEANRDESQMLMAIQALRNDFSNSGGPDHFASSSSQHHAEESPETHLSDGRAGKPTPPLQSEAGWISRRIGEWRCPYILDDMASQCT